MEWIETETRGVAVKSWCREVEPAAMTQALNLARHPAVFHHVALMPDCHVGYGMPIGGVIACENAVIPNAVGVDIGCGMAAVKTDIPAERFAAVPERRALIERVKTVIPVGEGAARSVPLNWDEFGRYRDETGGGLPWPNRLDTCNLGTLGGGNHFIELQCDEEGMTWLMLHSGSRNLGYRIANHYHRLAQELNAADQVTLPHAELAFLPLDRREGQDYLRDMNFALAYARENRRIMLSYFKEAVDDAVGGVRFTLEVNIHHNYAAAEEHFGRRVWVHRKGATSAGPAETGIIPGSMGTPSYIVRGRGNPESFRSCSHGAGRRMGRQEASRKLSVEECDRAMDGIVFDRWSRFHSKWKKKGDARAQYDLGEAPPAYKNIDEVIASELDLIEPLVKLFPLAVIKG